MATTIQTTIHTFPTLMAWLLFASRTDVTNATVLPMADGRVMVMV